MKISGYWFSADNSTRHAADLLVTNKQYRLMLGESLQASGALDELSFSDRVGDITRKVYWPDGSMLESADNNSIDQMLRSAGHKSAGSQFIHRLEKSGKFALLSLVVAVFVGFAFFKWGIPFAAKQIAWRLPVSVNEVVSKGTFDTLERFIFEPSELDVARQSEIGKRFTGLVASLPDEGFNYRLYFRNLGGVPNAMALPSGQVVVTDALVEMIEHPAELDSILLHEIGHVVNRHGVQSVIRASALSIIAALVIGDVSGTAELIAGLPVFLMQSSYSRESESEADDFAFAQMVVLNLDPAYFASIMKRMSGIAEQAEQSGDHAGGEPGREVSEYFSSHPDSQARADNAKAYSEQHFKK